MSIVSDISNLKSSHHPISNVSERHVGDPATDNIGKVPGVGVRVEASDEVEIEREMSSNAPALISVVQHSIDDVGVCFCKHHPEK